MIKKIAHTLMCVAASILVLTGVPSSQVSEQFAGIGQNAHADRETKGFHGLFVDSGGSCVTEQSLEDVVDHMVGHCNPWQPFVRVLASIAVAAVFGVVLIAVLPAAATASIATITFTIQNVLLVGAGAIGVFIAVKLIVGWICRETWKGWEDWC